MNVHRIRLRGPWRYQWLSHPEHEPQSGRVKLPEEWRALFGEKGGQVRFLRTFHSPTNLQPSTRVDLVFEGLGGEARIVLNDRDLARPVSDDNSPPRFEITKLLLPSNDLQVEIRFHPEESSEPGGLWGPVVLEIRE